VNDTRSRDEAVFLLFASLFSLQDKDKVVSISEEKQKELLMRAQISCLKSIYSASLTTTG
jgi:hypothetical protein